MDEKMLLIVAGILLFLFFIVGVLRSKRPVRNGIISMLAGLAALITVNMAGTPVAINHFNVLLALTLGVPGVMLILILFYLI